jgi:hypothetical protein
VADQHIYLSLGAETLTCTVARLKIGSEL